MKPERLSNVEELIQQLRPHLREYLESWGIDCNRHFQCLHPEHTDEHPSCHLLPGGEVAHCYGCHRTFNIFMAAYHLEGLPCRGPEFLSLTLPALAQRFQLEVKLKPLTPAEQERLEIYRAYEAASRIILGFPPSPRIQEELERRQWRQELLQELGVGWVSSFQDYFQEMLSLGFTQEFLDRIDLGHRQRKPSPIFTSDKLIFTYYDERGRVCGFASRDLYFETTGNGNQKYCNTTSQVSIYPRRGRLYGLFRAPKDTPLYLVEGYADWVTLQHHGITNAAALCGTSFHSQHLETLGRLGLRHLILALDGDEAGQQATEKAVLEVLSNRKEWRLQVLTLPDNLDPDEFLRRHGREAWERLPRPEAFDWCLSRFPAETEPEEIAQRMLPLVVNEPSFLRQEVLLQRLAAATGFTLTTLQLELNRLRNRRNLRRLNLKEEALRETLAAALEDPDSAITILRQGIQRLESLDQEHGLDFLGSQEYLEHLQGQSLKETSKAPEPECFRLGPDLSFLERCLEGADLKTAWVAMGGSGNVGKTSLACKLAHAIALHNPVTVIYHTIDDVREKIINRLALLTLGPERESLPLNWLKHPNYYVRFDPALPEKHRLAYERLQALAQEERLVVKGIEHGTSLGAVENLLAYYRQRHPDRDLVYILDNFHLLDRLSLAQKDHERLSDTMRDFKRLLGRYRVTGITTVEYTKLDPACRPGNHNIYGSVQLEYEADIIIHLYNELHGLPDSRLYHCRPGRSERLPIIELIFGKNKVNDFKGSVYLYMFPEQGDFRHAPLEAVLPLLQDPSRPRQTWRQGRLISTPSQETISDPEEYCHA